MYSSYRSTRVWTYFGHRVICTIHESRDDVMVVSVRLCFQSALFDSRYDPSVVFFHKSLHSHSAISMLKWELPYYWDHLTNSGMVGVPVVVQFESLNTTYRNWYYASALIGDHFCSVHSLLFTISRNSYQYDNVKRGKNMNLV